MKISRVPTVTWGTVIPKLKHHCTLQPDFSGSERVSSESNRLEFLSPQSRVSQTILMAALTPGLLPSGATWEPLPPGALATRATWR